MTKNEILEKAFIPIQLWNLCNVSEDGKITTPTLEDKLNNGIISKEEYEKLSSKIDNLTQIKNNEDLTNENKQLWQTVEFLLKNTGFIPKEA